MTCRDCGQVEHAGGCDLVEFYHFQRWMVPAKRDAHPTPPSPQIIDDAPGCDEAPHLSVQTQISTHDEYGNIQFTPLASVTNAPETKQTKVKVVRPKQGKIMTTGKAKPVDDPVVAARREEIRQKRVERMAYVRSHRKAKSV